MNKEKRKKKGGGGEGWGAEEIKLYGEKLVRYIKKNPNKKWAYGIDVYGVERWTEICDRLYIHYRDPNNERCLIIALKDIERWGVKKGDIGGYVHDGWMSDLNQMDDSWIWDSSTHNQWDSLRIDNNTCYYYGRLAHNYGDNKSKNWKDKYNNLNDGQCYGNDDMFADNGAKCNLGQDLGTTIDFG